MLGTCQPLFGHTVDFGGRERREGGREGGRERERERETVCVCVCLKEVYTMVKIYTTRHDLDKKHSPINILNGLFP